MPCPAKADIPIVEDFLSYLAVCENASGATRLAYERDLERFKASLPAGTDPSAATSEQVRGFLARELARGLSARSVVRRLAALRSYFRFLVRERGRKDDPTARVDAPRTSRPLPRVLGEGEVSAVLSLDGGHGARGLRDRLLLELLYATGARASEVASLTLADAGAALASGDGARGLRVLGKGGRERLLPLGSRARALLERYLAEGRPRLARGPVRDELLLSRTGRPLDRRDVFRVVKSALARAGLAPSRASPHTFRHSFATHMVERGADLRVVQELLGHARVTTTEVYTHVDARRRAAVHRAFHPRGSVDGPGP
jgi:integrase/recombinase XerD